MNKLKDWFYNYSDIFTGVLITAVAGLIIFASVSDIMSFSDSFQVLAKDKNEGSSAVIHSAVSSGGIDVVEGDTGTDGVATPPAVNGSTNSGITSGGATAPITTPAATTGSAAGNTGQAASNTIRNRVTIVIPSGATGSKVAQLLKEGGLITDTNDFLTVLSSSKLDSKLRAGTFSIPEGSNVTEIINILTGK